MTVLTICSIRVPFIAVAVALGGIVIGEAQADTPLTNAVKVGDRSAVERLLARRGAPPSEVNATEADGSTALHWAVHADDREMVHLLLRAGANVNVATRNHVTPLSLAAENRNAAIAAVLLEAGADPNARLANGQTVLMMAAHTGSAALMKLLLEAGADVAAREDLAGETALMWGAAENHHDVVRVMVSHGADVNARSTRLRFSREMFGDGIVALPTVLPKGWWTPLMYAARQNALEAVVALLNAGADPDVVDSEGTSALTIAINNAHYDVAATLLQRGADPNLADEAGMTALFAAFEMNTAARTPGRPLAKPSGELRALDVIKLLLERGANPNAALTGPLLPKQHMASTSLGQGMTALMRAARTGDLPAMRVLLDYGADAQAVTRSKTNALMVAAGATGVALQDQLTAIAVCLEHGVDINAVNENGESALHQAISAGDAVVTFLAERGAKLDLKDKQGRTPLDVALGVGGGRRGGAPQPRATTAVLLRELMARAGIVVDSNLRPVVP